MISPHQGSADMIDELTTPRMAVIETEDGELRIVPFCTIVAPDEPLICDTGIPCRELATAILVRDDDESMAACRTHSVVEPDCDEDERAPYYDADERKAEDRYRSSALVGNRMGFLTIP